jgi:hypothetical protein
VLDNLTVTRAGDVLVATYTAQTDATLDGGAVDFGAPAPRLTVFQQIDGANGSWPPTPTSAPPATAADAGS